MTKERLAATIEKLLKEAGANLEAPKMQLRTRGANTTAAPTYEEIANDLAQQAFASGDTLSNFEMNSQRLGGGNTAEVVALLTARAPFILKYDSKDDKLAREGALMREIRRGTNYPEPFRSAWPIVYAVRSVPPYAYLMEYFSRSDGWRSLEEYLYPLGRDLPPTTSQAQRHVDAALDILFAGYGASKVKRIRVSLNEDYVGRIRQRLEAAAARDPRFASKALIINGEAIEPWEAYLRQLDENPAYLAKIDPPFSTVVHGDPNPGNIMLRTETSGIQIKLIDPKDWERGDYLFDLAKITHFLEDTGPIEKPQSGMPLDVRYEGRGAFGEIRYAIDRPAWTRRLVEACLDRAEQFAVEHGDAYWHARYELGMASNLLGLPEGRLKQERADAAVALYAEGLLWIRRFCARLRPLHTGAIPTLARAAATVIEPDDLARARAHVRATAPSVKADLDRRGFQLLHWAPARPSAKNKPPELSFEHEARLMPRSEAGLAALQQELARATGDVARLLLPGHAQFGELQVSRYPRDPGAQSVDHYWDAQNVPEAQRLIPRMLSLRERIRTSEFMTWGSTERQRALNLELPQVALGHTGVLARLEFNWIDELDIVLRELKENQTAKLTDNPMVLASQLYVMSTVNYAPVIEHTTFREKFAITTPGEGDQLFQLNIDHVVAQSLQTRRFASYTDIDIAPGKPVDAAMLEMLIGFSSALAGRFELAAVDASKVWRDASLLGELGGEA